MPTRSKTIKGEVVATTPADNADGTGKRRRPSRTTDVPGVVVNGPDTSGVMLPPTPSRKPRRTATAARKTYPSVYAQTVAETGIDPATLFADYDREFGLDMRLLAVSGQVQSR